MVTTVAPPTDTDIRIALSNIIRTSLVGLYGSPKGNDVVIWDHWPLAFALGEAGSTITVFQGVELGIIHSWAIRLSGISRKRPTSDVNNMGSARLKTVGPNRRDQIKTYSVWCFRELELGTEGSESTNNSEAILSTEIDTVADAISLSPTLGLTNPWIQGHEEIQFSPIDSFIFGENMVNIAQGSLSVVLQRPLSLNSA